MLGPPSSWRTVTPSSQSHLGGCGVCPGTTPTPLGMLHLCIFLTFFFLCHTLAYECPTRCLAASLPELSTIRLEVGSTAHRGLSLVST